jgi:hypothetical protein
MPDYERTTTETTLERGGLLSRLKGSADRDPEHDVAFVIGPSDLLVATHGERSGTAVLVARLEDLELGSLTATIRAARA